MTEDFFLVLVSVEANIQNEPFKTLWKKIYFFFGRESFFRCCQTLKISKVGLSARSTTNFCFSFLSPT